jgi:RNA polymerase I-specific transcription initiation factor RRN7
MNKFVEAIDSNFIRTFSSLNETESLKSARWIQLSRIPRLGESIALCLVGTHLLRLPVFPGDFLRWIKSGEMVYVNAASLHLPNDMRVRLDKGIYVALNPLLALSAESLHQSTLGTFRAYAEEFGMAIPPLNLSLCLYRLMEELALPLDTYFAAKKLVRLLPTQFEFSKTWDDPLKGKGSLMASPYAKLAAYFIVAVKLLYPFDMTARTPKTTEEPTVAVVDWSLWNKLHQELLANQQNEGGKGSLNLSYEDTETVTERDILLMDQEKLDQYMDWLEPAATRKESDMLRRNDFAKELFGMFPVEKDHGNQRETSTSSHSASSSTSRQEFQAKLQSGLLVRKVITDDAEDADTDAEKSLRPGQQYQRYHPVESLGRHGEIPKAFYSAVADLIGLSLKDVTEAAREVEQQLLNWLMEERKRQRQTKMELD